ncbi:uncharacterized protein LOC119594320 [Penaeus monodon]|uniref:uncharacterized protein LOC119594320 n=1 Tax=Penaeus monodon TaxID=6687 RepID=UPI0018A75192|nr:uncharacterized protein LOC119594320 [Penaeus monodon]
MAPQIDTAADTTQVEVVEGYNASLPCSIHSPTHDTPVLTLWYIGTDETPVYSYDQRPNERGGTEWSDALVFGSRVKYLPFERPPVLLLTNVSTMDARLYRCRVDFHKSNSRQAWIRLSVTVPPSKIEVIPRISPVELGQRDDVRIVMLALPPTLLENVSPASYKLDSVPHAVLHTAIASHSLVLNRRTSGRACRDIIDTFSCIPLCSDLPLLCLDRDGVPGDYTEETPTTPANDL